MRKSAKLGMLFSNNRYTYVRACMLFQTIGTPMCAHVCPFLVVQQSSFLICVKADMCERDFWL